MTTSGQSSTQVHWTPRWAIWALLNLQISLGSVIAFAITGEWLIFAFTLTFFIGAGWGALGKEWEPGRTL